MIEGLINRLTSRRQRKKQEPIDGWVRVTLIMREKIQEKLIAFAYWKNIEKKEAVDYILGEFFKQPENKTQVRRKSSFSLDKSK